MTRTTTRTGRDAPRYEFRITFPAKLASAALAHPDAPLPARPRADAPASPPAPPADPAEFWKSDLARELQADRAHIEGALAEIRGAVAELRRDQAERLKQWQRAAVELAVTLATRLLHQRVTANEFPVEAKVRDMAGQMESGSPATVWLNPADLELLESRLGGEPLLPGRDDPRLVADAALARGDCRVEGKEGLLLSEVARELHEIRDELLGSLAHARP